MGDWADFALAIMTIVWVILFLTAALYAVTWMVGKMADILERAFDRYRARRFLGQR